MRNLFLPTELLARLRAAAGGPLGWLLALLPAGALAQPVVITGLTGSEDFGTTVTVLPNGNYVVTDPYFDQGSVQNVGAVYLYNGSTNARISTLTGSTANDYVGNDRVTVLANGNYVVSSASWDNGAVANAGAATWCSGTTGLNGTISAANSLVGTSASDQVGSDRVTALPGGNYVVRSTNWNNGAAGDAGAVTWGSGTGGTAGPVSAANSLVGTTVGDAVGNGGITVLTNGNYVVSSYYWGNGAATRAGAVTWGGANAPLVGPVSAANSLVGTATNDKVGITYLLALTNGNYVVASPFVKIGTKTEAGAATWGNGSTGTVGAVTAANSLVGAASYDHISRSYLTALTDGNYVVRSSEWNRGAVSDAGAATWGNGSTGTVGLVSAANSFTGSVASDQVGTYVQALPNGNYLISSPYWHNGGAANAGAVTWRAGGAPAVGVVSATNSLVGSTANDYVGNSFVPVLTNGNYVVSSSSWDNGTVVDAGAATWCNANGSTVGAVSAANSLVGTTANDRVSSSLNGVAALTNGNYVVSSRQWNNGSLATAGAATWCNGSTGRTGAVSAANSLVGTTAGDQVGDDIEVLTNGNYVVSTTVWDNGAVADAGAATWCDGSTGRVGTVSAANSLVGTTASDRVGVAVAALTNGNYAVNSFYWSNGAAANAGAATWGNGSTGTVGAVSATNSLVGTTANDYVGTLGAEPDGNYVVVNQKWHNGALDMAGAFTLGNGTGGTAGPVTPCNSAVGTVANSGNMVSLDYRASTRTLFVGLPYENKVQLGAGPTAAPTGAASQSFGPGATVASLVATGTAVQWYATATGGAALASTTPLVNGTTYYASQTVTGCESTGRLAVAVTIVLPNQVPTALALSNSSVAENAGANATVGTFSTTDPDAGNTFTYTLVGGAGSADNAAFTISGSTLRLTASADFETQNSYSVRVRTTDQGSLFFEQPFTIAVADVNELTATVTGHTEVLCYGGSTGTATAAGGSEPGPYHYSWNTTPAQTTATATGLTAGTYTVTVTRPAVPGHSATATATIAQPGAALAATTTQTNATTNGGSNGTATVNANGGTPAYAYSWTTTPVQTTATATGLSAGPYTVTVTDANGCTTQRTVTITQPAAPALPALSGIAPASAPVGTSVTLTGSNLGGATAVTFAGTGTNTVTTGLTVSGTGSNQTIAVAVPTGATTGPVTVTTPNGTSNGVSFALEPDLTISTGSAGSPVGIAAGTYHNITVTGTGFATLSGAVAVTGAVAVSGDLNTNCQPLTGAGSFALAAGATLHVCDPAGLTATGSSGAVQLTPRSFAPDASYVYNGTAAQVTGAGLPTTVRNLSTTNASPVTLTRPVAVAQTLTVGGAGNLALNGQALTLRSDASGTALVVNSGAGLVTGGTATMQRYLTTANPGLGYRHYASPVGGNDLTDLATSGFAPVFNSAYNSSPTPGSVAPFPNVFGYDQSRLAAAASNYAPFDQGYFSPVDATGTVAAFVPGVGYTVQIAGTQKVDFTGTLNTGTYPRTLARNAATTPGAASAGYHLVGNPYPAPLDYSLVDPADRSGLDAAMYVFESTGPYQGTYRTYLPPVGGQPGIGNPLVGSSQGFFVRVSTPGTNGTLNFRDDQRVTDYATQQVVRRGPADTRPLLTLELAGATGPADALTVYAQAGATASLDSQFDAAKLANPSGLNLASLTTTGEALAIDGRPAFAATTVVPLQVAMPAAGSYTFTAASLNNLTGTRVELVDNLTTTRTLLAAGTAYRFTTITTTAPGRFWLNLAPAAGALATAPAALAAQVLAYPNPATGRFTLTRPAGSGPATAALFNALGQVVRTLALPTAETQVDVRGLATGVYTLRLTLDGQPLTKRLVID